MSKIVKGVKKGLKKVGKFVKKHWKPIAMAAGVAFTAGLATPGLGFSGLSSAISSKGILGGIGSTMWAGAQSLAGTVGLGSGVGGQTLLNNFTGAQGASSLGGLMFGKGSAASGAGAGGLNQVGWNPISGAAPYAGNIAAGGPPGTGGQRRGGGLLGNILGGNMGPALVGAAGQYFSTRAEQEAAEPRALWGVDFEGGNKAHQPWGSPNTATDTVPYAPVPLAGPQARRRSAGPLLDPDNPNFMNGGPYG